MRCRRAPWLFAISGSRVRGLRRGGGCAARVTAVRPRWSTLRRVTGAALAMRVDAQQLMARPTDGGALAGRGTPCMAWSPAPTTSLSLLAEVVAALREAHSSVSSVHASP